MSARPADNTGFIQSNRNDYTASSLNPYVIVDNYNDYRVKNVDPSKLFVYVSNSAVKEDVPSNVIVVSEDPPETLRYRIHRSIQQLIDRNIQIETAAEALNGLKAALTRDGINTLPQLVDKLNNRTTPQQAAPKVKFGGASFNGVGGFNDILFKAGITVVENRQDVTLWLQSSWDINKDQTAARGRHVVLVGNNSLQKALELKRRSSRKVAFCLVPDKYTAVDLLGALLDGLDWFNYSSALPLVTSSKSFEELREQMQKSIG